MVARGLPSNRLDPYRDGMITTTRIKISFSVYLYQNLIFPITDQVQVQMKNHLPPSFFHIKKQLVSGSVDTFLSAIRLAVVIISAKMALSPSVRSLMLRIMTPGNDQQVHGGVGLMSLKTTRLSFS